MADFPIFHGITLAANAYLENLVVEKLAVDPSSVEAGRVWYNTTDKVFRQSTLDASGAVIVRTFATAEDLAAEVTRATAAEGVLTTALAAEVTRATSAEGVLASNLATETARATTAEQALASDLATEVTRATAAEGVLTSDLATEVTRATAAETALTTALAAEVTRATTAEQALDSRISALGSAFNYVSTLTGGADAASALDLASLAQKDAGDYYKVASAGWFKVGAGSAFYANTGDGLVWNLVNGIDKIDNTDSSVAGTPDYIAVSGSTDTGFVVDVATQFKSRVATLESGLQQEITDRGAADTALNNLISQEVTNRTNAVSLVRTDYNAKRYTYQSATAATTHTVAHNLNTAFVDFSVMVERPNGLYRNDVVSVEEFDSNTLKVYLASAQKIKIAVTSMASL